MLVQALINGIKRATLSGKEEIGTRIVGKLKVTMVVGDPFSSEQNSCDAVLALAACLLGVLELIDFRHHVIAQPGVHNKQSATVLFEQTNDGIRVGHSSGIAEANTCPLVACFCLNNKLN